MWIEINKYRNCTISVQDSSAYENVGLFHISMAGGLFLSRLSDSNKPYIHPYGHSALIMSYGECIKLIDDWYKIDESKHIKNMNTGQRFIYQGVQCIMMDKKAKSPKYRSMLPLDYARAGIIQEIHEDVIVDELV